MAHFSAIEAPKTSFARIRSLSLSCLSGTQELEVFGSKINSQMELSEPKRMKRVPQKR